MMTQNGKLLYISDNAAEYLGHSMEDLLIHGDSVYDMIDKQDHQSIQTELMRSPATQGDDHRLFLCRMNVSRNARRQMRFGDQKVVLVKGHYLSFLPLCSRNEPVFLATCTPVAMPETRECVVQGATNVFTAIHSMDMKFIHIDRNGEFHLGFPRSELQGASWYHLLHWDCMREAQSKHRLITQSEQDRSCILLLRLQRRTGDWVWIHCVLQVKENMENSQQPVIVSTNQVLCEEEAGVLRANSWLYHYYLVQSKLQYGLAYETARMPAAAVAYYQHPHAMSPYQEHTGSYHQISASLPTQPHIHYQNSTLQQSIESNFRYGKRTEPEPVDYSLHSSQEDTTPAPTPPEGRSLIKQEIPLAQPMKTELSPQSSPSSEVIVDLDRGCHESGGGTLLLTTAASLRRPRILVKAAAAPAPDPAEFMEQWNPSPPWSDSAVQKVPDIVSPYVTTTPPTPSSLQPPPHSAFSFDWSGSAEQYVPSTHGDSAASPMDEDHYPTLLASFPWSSEHRLFPLQPPPAVARPSLIVRLDSEPIDHHHIPVKDSREIGDSNT
ncbi:unnamed protein product [Bemisia tabaci]|uniref:PAS domain-containing protein n=3 Tax=Bemisia tabaci TaxID=7038 RepID=A0A9P0AAK4_BEMTA|nr:unnamed protein product [Bemisia tabaci]